MDGWTANPQEYQLQGMSYRKSNDLVVALRIYVCCIQVILGLAMPFYIRQLDFKSKEELQQMPQTEEEHLENQNLDNDDSDRSQPDAEVFGLLFSITLSYFVHFLLTFNLIWFRCLYVPVLNVCLIRFQRLRLIIQFFLLTLRLTFTINH